MSGISPIAFAAMAFGTALGALVTWLLLRGRVADRVALATAPLAAEQAVQRERTVHAERERDELRMRVADLGAAASRLGEMTAAVTRAEAALLQEQQVGVVRVGGLEAQLTDLRTQLVAMRQEDAGRAHELARAAADLTEARTELDHLRRTAADGFAEREARLARAEDLLRGRELQLDQRSQDVATLQAERAQLAAQLAEQEKRLAETSTVLAGMQQQMKDAFAALSGETLKATTEQFFSLAQAQFARLQEGAQGELAQKQKAVDDIVRPVAETLGKLDAHLRESEQARAGSFAALSQQVQSLLQCQGELQNTTRALGQALRNPSTRGRWGELQLRTAVEYAGMLDQCDFLEQETITGEESNLRPDMIVRLPGGRSVVVDSKVPLSAYLEALEASEPGIRAARLAQHARQLRKHVDDLASKEYWARVPGSPDFVVCFLPSEAVFAAAVEQDLELIADATRRRVVLATPTTLIAMLIAVAYGWNQQRLAENAEQISTVGRELHERVATLAKHMDGLRKNLHGAVEGFNDVVGSLESRLLPSARKLEQLGAGSGKTVQPINNVVTIPRQLRAPELQEPVTPLAPSSAEAGDDVRSAG